MNIDIRNASKELEKSIAEAKKQYCVNTNSRAVEKMCINFWHKVEHIEELTVRISNLQKENQLLKNKINVATNFIKEFS